MGGLQLDGGLDDFLIHCLGTNSASVNFPYPYNTFASDYSCKMLIDLVGTGTYVHSCYGLVSWNGEAGACSQESHISVGRVCPDPTVGVLSLRAMFTGPIQKWFLHSSTLWVSQTWKQFSPCMLTTKSGLELGQRAMFGSWFQLFTNCFISWQCWIHPCPFTKPC